MNNKNKRQVKNKPKTANIKEFLLLDGVISKYYPHHSHWSARNKNRNKFNNFLEVCFGSDSDTEYRLFFRKCYEFSLTSYNKKNREKLESIMYLIKESLTGRVQFINTKGEHILSK